MKFDLATEDDAKEDLLRDIDNFKYKIEEREDALQMVVESNQ